LTRRQPEDHGMTRPPAVPAIRMIDVSHTFGEVRALDGLSMEIPTGSVFGFLGPNGAGKTTTIRLLLGLLKPSSGSIQVFGNDPNSEGDKVRRAAGVLLDPVGLYAMLSVEDNLEFHGRIWKLSSSERRARIDELLVRFDLAGRRKDQAGKLSRGMKQKLAIARALLHNPSLLLLDEPTAGLDPEAVADLRTSILEWAREKGATVFLTTHNLGEAQRVCDRVGVIRKGRMIAFGTPSELSAGGGGKRLRFAGSAFDEGLVAKLQGNHGIENVELGADFLVTEGGEAMVAAPIVRAIVTMGGEINEIEEETSKSLEDVYLDAVRDAG
jgi:ABC-2 type transport system ATP-binding protein